MALCDQPDAGCEEFHAVLDAYITHASGGARPSDSNRELDQAHLEYMARTPGILCENSRNSLLAGEHTYPDVF